MDLLNFFTKNNAKIEPVKLFETLFTKQNVRLMDEVEPINLLNIILVMEDVRPAMLFQPINYGEPNSSYPISTQILTSLKEAFPDLYYSENYSTYQGVIISKQSYNSNFNISLERMGQILGYPCYQDININNRTPGDNNKTNDYRISINAYFHNKKSVELFINVAKDTSKLPLFHEIAKNAENVLKSDKYKHLLHNTIHYVDVKVDKIIHTKSLITKLINKIEFTQDEKDEISNTLYNFGFSETTQMKFVLYFEYDNLIHQGILLSLLAHYDNDRLSAFFPLQNYPNQDKDVNEITSKWEKSIIDILLKTCANKQQTIKQIN
jgi:hypothetical protein